VEDLATSVRLADGRETEAVRGVSFTLGRGRMLGLVGESGSGKSLTALSILRLLPEPQVRITRGRVLLNGVDLVRASERTLCDLRGRVLGAIFQEPSTALNPVMKVGTQVGEALRVHEGLSRAAALRRAVELLAMTGIPSPEERADAYPHQLSGGMKQRAMIALALACRPSLLLADEPTTALDVTVQAEILALLNRLRRELGMAILLITHDLGVVAETCDDVAVLYAGRIVEQAPAATLFAGPRHPYTAGLLRALPSLGDAPEAAKSDGDHPGDHQFENRVRPRLLEIPGTVPALGRFPPGCAFAPRCERALADCLISDPPLLPAPGGPAAANHALRCFHPLPAPAASGIKA
jgi:peptide/nickel transport system ATP-binding protein